MLCQRDQGTGRKGKGATAKGGERQRRQTGLGRHARHAGKEGKRKEEGGGEEERRTDTKQRESS